MRILQDHEVGNTSEHSWKGHMNLSCESLFVSLNVKSKIMWELSTQDDEDGADDEEGDALDCVGQALVPQCQQLEGGA